MDAVTIDPMTDLPSSVHTLYTMGDYGWSMDSDTPKGIDAVEYGRVLEYPKRRNKSQTTRKPDLFR